MQTPSKSAYWKDRESRRISFGVIIGNCGYDHLVPTSCNVTISSFFMLPNSVVDTRFKFLIFCRLNKLFHCKENFTLPPAAYNNLFDLVQCFSSRTALAVKFLSYSVTFVFLISRKSRVVMRNCEWIKNRG